MKLKINKNSKIALIGCGYWGSILTNSLLQLGYRNIVVYDQNHKNSKTLKQKFNHIKISHSLGQILYNEKIKTIILATPPKNNFNLIKKCIYSKKNIFLEKPGIKDFKKMKLLTNLAKKNKIIFMLGYVYCYNDYIKKIRNIIKSKILGKIHYIKLERKNLGPIRNDVDSSFDLASHDLSIAAYLFGSRKKIQVINFKKHKILNKRISDINYLYLKLENILIDIETSWLNPNKVRSITIIGTKKMLFFNEMDSNEPLKIFNKYANYPKIQNFKKKFFNQKAKIYYGDSYSIKVKEKQSVQNELTYFFNCINKNKTPFTDGLFAAKILKLLN